MVRDMMPWQGRDDALPGRHHHEQDRAGERTRLPRGGAGGHAQVPLRLPRPAPPPRQGLPSGAGPRHRRGEDGHGEDTVCV